MKYLSLLVLSAVAMFTMVFSYMVGQYTLEENGPMVYAGIAFGITGVAITCLIYAFLRAIMLFFGSSDEY